jgi:TolA-binding protein
MKAPRSRLPWGGLPLLATLALTACAQERDIAILRNDMERLNRQLVQMQVSQEVSQSKPRELVQRELEGERRNIADMKAGLDDLRQQVSVLTERLEASNVQMSRRVGALEAKLSPGASSTPMGSRSGPAGTGQTPIPGAPTGDSPGTPSAAAAPSSAEAKRLYQAALGDYQRGKFDLAAQGFRTYLRKPQRVMWPTRRSIISQNHFTVPKTTAAPLAELSAWCGLSSKPSGTTPC